MTQHLVPLAKYSSLERVLTEWTVFTELPKFPIEQRIIFLRDQLGCFGNNFIPVSLLTGLLHTTSVIPYLYDLITLEPNDAYYQIVALTCLVNMSVCPLVAEWFEDRPAYFVGFFQFLKSPTAMKQSFGNRGGLADHYKRTAETMWFFRHVSIDSAELRETCLELGVIKNAAETISAMYELDLTESLCTFMWACSIFFDGTQSEFDNGSHMVPVLGMIMKGWYERPSVTAFAIGLMSLILNQKTCEFSVVLSQVPDFFISCTQISRAVNDKVRSRFCKLLLSISSQPAGLLHTWYESGLISLLNGVLFSCRTKDESTVLWAISNFLCTSHTTVWDGHAIREIMKMTMQIVSSDQTPKSTLRECVFIFFNVAIRNGGPLIQYLLSEDIFHILEKLIVYFSDDSEATSLLCETLYWIVIWNISDLSDSTWKKIFLLLPRNESDRFWKFLNIRFLQELPQDLPQIEKLSLRDFSSKKRLPDIAALSLIDE